MIPFDGIHRTLPDGTVLSLYRQLYNFKLTRSSPESWRYQMWDDGW